MARSLVAAVALLAVMVQPARADDSPDVPDDVVSVANDAGVNPVDLAGAMVSTHEDMSAEGARHYLLGVHELVTPTPVADAPPRVSGSRVYVKLTYYVMNSGVTASGGHVYTGSTACSTNFALGTRFILPDDSEVTCNDRGVLGTSGWLDVFGRPDIGRMGGGYVTVLN
jgi:hypothetical protein